MENFNEQKAMYDKVIFLFSKDSFVIFSLISLEKRRELRFVAMEHCHCQGKSFFSWYFENFFIDIFTFFFFSCVQVCLWLQASLDFHCKEKLKLDIEVEVSFSLSFFVFSESLWGKASDFKKEWGKEEKKREKESDLLTWLSRSLLLSLRRKLSSTPKDWMRFHTTYKNLKTSSRFLLSLFSYFSFLWQIFLDFAI